MGDVNFTAIASSSSKKSEWMFASQTDAVLKNYAQYIDDFGYSTLTIGTVMGVDDYLVFTNQISERKDLVTTGLSPSKLVDTCIYPEYYNTSTGLGLIEQLYTARGTQSHGEDVDLQSDLSSFDP